jgi:hypothetical protein
MNHLQESIKFLFPETSVIGERGNDAPVEVFADSSIDFLNALSSELMKDPRSRAYPDVITFAFFCRRANILRYKNIYANESEIRLGRGCVFHITPGNVPINFAYSLVAGILSGNTNIVKVPSKNFVQVEIVCDSLGKVADSQRFASFGNRITVVQYERKSKATDYFSSICDVRVIWGGDNTVIEVKKSLTPPRSFDIVFPDRYSFCVINAERYLKAEDQGKIAEGFFNDTYLLDQNACTAPHLIVWMGDKNVVASAQTLFWNLTEEMLKKKDYQSNPVNVVDKLTQFYLEASDVKGIKHIKSGSNDVWRIMNETMSPKLETHRCHCGYFNEIIIDNLAEIAPFITPRFQTMAYWGFSKPQLREFLKSEKPLGIDRVVPIGKTLDFSLIWDGIDLIHSMSRVINII